MIKTYSFKLEGTAGGNGTGQTWETSGCVACEFPEVFDRVTAASFHQLTHGEAVFGHPGVGCNGPYGVKRVLIEEFQE